MTTLAIAAPRFGSPSETFIDNHARLLAPGRTVLLCQHDSKFEQIGFPVLANVERMERKRGLGPRIANGLLRRWQAHMDPSLLPDERHAVVTFLQEQGAGVMLAEYGPIACRYMRSAATAGIDLVVHFHGYDASLLLRSRTQVRNYRVLFQRAAGIVCPSDYLAQRLREIGCPPAKLHVNPYGVEADRFVPGDRDTRRFVAVGRLVEKKAPHLSIQAFAAVAERFPDAVLDLVGAGPLEELCRQTIIDLGLDGRVRMHGAQPHHVVAELMGRASVFVQHSITSPEGDTEGLPVAILEAMSAGLAIVSTLHAGIPEAVVDGFSGVLVAERDVKGMAQAMVRLASDSALRDDLGRAARERVTQRFSLAQSSARLRGVLRLDSNPSVPLGTK